MATCPVGHSSDATDYCDVCGARIGGAAPSTPASSTPAPSTSAPSTSAPSTPAPGSASAPRPGGPGAPGGAGAVCPDCSTPQTGRFCENCGYDFAVGAGRPTTTGPMRVPPGTASGPPGTASGPSGGGNAGAGTGRWPAAPASRPTTPDITVPARDVTSPSRRAGSVTSWTAIVAADRDYYETVVRQAGGPEAAGFAFPPYCPERRIPLSGRQVLIGRRSVSQGTVPEIDLGEPPEDPGASHTHAVLLAQPDGTWNLVDPGSTNGTTVNGGEDPIAVNVEVPMHDGDRIHVGVWTTITLRRG